MGGMQFKQEEGIQRVNLLIRKAKSRGWLHRARFTTFERMRKEISKLINAPIKIPIKALFVHGSSAGISQTAQNFLPTMTGGTLPSHTENDFKSASKELLLEESPSEFSAERTSSAKGELRAWLSTAY